MIRAIAPFALAPLLLAGCGGSGGGLVSVGGTVTLEGKPLRGAQVTFAPHPNNPRGTPGLDITGGSGYYKIMSGGRSGLTPGKYTVVVSKTERTGTTDGGADPYMMTLASQARSRDGSEPADETIEATFQREVSSSGDTFDFDLKRPVKEPPPEEPPQPPPTKKGQAKKGSTPGRRR
jgi:hypothetical protein